MELCYDGALVMPSNYAVMDEEEMTYVEGGERVSRSRCIAMLAGAGINAKTIIACGNTVYAACAKVVKSIAKAFGGFVGWIAGAVLAYAGSQILKFATGIAYGATRSRGVDITWNWNVFDFGVHYR